MTRLSDVQFLAELFLVSPTTGAEMEIILVSGDGEGLTLIDVGNENEDWQYSLRIEER